MCTLVRYLGSMFFGVFLTYLYCLVGYLSVIVRTHAVLGVLYAWVLYFCICTCSAQLSMIHMKRCSRNTLIIITIIIITNIIVVSLLLLSLLLVVVVVHENKRSKPEAFI